MMAHFAFRLALICGGPSDERGVSLNSARSLMDHLQSFEVELIVIYVNTAKSFYQISPSQLYSNTPQDFDFKLEQIATALNFFKLKNLLKTVDLVFPVIHGLFGEDGELQALLESLKIPFVGSSSLSCQRMFFKHVANEELTKEKWLVLPYLALNSSHLNQHQEVIKNFFKINKIEKAVIKPSNGGSSIGVSVVYSVQEACEAFKKFIENSFNQTFMIEKFCEGIEFTVVVLQNDKGDPVALLPTEIELRDKSELFDYRKKYLPTDQSTYYTPARFSFPLLQNIRLQAQKLFNHFKMQDFVRLDGWVTKEGTLYFTDNNPLSGLEQNSFLFLQAAAIGMSHSQTLHYLIRRACYRQQILPPLFKPHSKPLKKPVYVLFGGDNAERQVSLMSGTNVWLKLLQSADYEPTPFFLDHNENVWQLPYFYNLSHTVEEVYNHCIHQNNQEKYSSLIAQIQLDLGQNQKILPVCSIQTLQQWIEQAFQQQAFVFLALHGGKGEDGTFQKMLESKGISFNGSCSAVSYLCMDKYETGRRIDALHHKDLSSLPKCSFFFSSYFKSDWEVQWKKWSQQLKSAQLIIKPCKDGCSAGIVLLKSAKDLALYAQFHEQRISFIPPYTFTDQVNPIEMPSHFDDHYLLEPYIEVDELSIEKDQLHYKRRQGWLELTVGVIEKNKEYHAFNPSLTVTKGAVLSLEEKFQAGTGINLTPPPLTLLSLFSIEKIKKLAETAACALNIESYARLDLFFNCLSQKMILIEANTLPALTPSTVIYHQALAETPPLVPLAFLEKIITSKLTCDKLNPVTSKKDNFSCALSLTS